ncbi:helix-turn-helix domain-containing protein [Magnetococcus sp. PR-3]|uniref:helix-turn-helix domain-containing protein n=1 Tax=Magnetococcus sp. PR-3 TaxID=3120355 RepID=UPI002FCE1B83
MSQSQLLQKSHFTANELPPEQRANAWAESIGTLFEIELDNQSPIDSFHASVNSFLLNDQLMLAHCQTRAQLFTRDSFRTSHDGLDHYMIQTHFSGEQHFKVGSQTHTCGPGEVAIIDLAEIHHSQATDFSNISLIIPRKLLSPLLNHPDSQEGHVLKANNSLAQIALNHLHTLHRLVPSLTQQQAAQLIQPTLLLVASAINGSTEKVEDGAISVAHAIHLKIKHNIELNLHDPQLSAEKICESVHISRASLYRLFKPMGGIKNYIQQRRLQHCAEALTQASQQHRLISEIAYCWGFSSQPHFSKIFKQRFQMTPQEFREKGGTLPSPPQLSEESPVGDRHYETWLSETLRL